MPIIKDKDGHEYKVIDKRPGAPVPPSESVPEKIPNTQVESPPSMSNTQNMDTGNAVNHAEKGAHLATQRGEYHGTLDQSHFIKYKQQQYAHYTSSVSYTRKWWWNTEYMNMNSAMHVKHAHDVARSNTIGTSTTWGQYQADGVIANVWFPSTRYMMDDWAYHLSNNVYNKCRLKWIEFNVKFNNVPISFDDFWATQVLKGADGVTDINTLRTQARETDAPAFRYQACKTSHTTTAGLLHGTFLLPDNTAVSQSRYNPKYWATSTSDNKFYIWRDIDGKMTTTASGPPKSGHNQEKPGPIVGAITDQHEHLGPTVSEVNTAADHLNREQIRNKYEGFIVDDNIYCFRTIHPEKQTVMTTAQQRLLVYDNKRWDELTRVLEGLPIVGDTYMTPQNEWFNFYFVPHGEFQYIDVGSINANVAPIYIPIVPFNTHMTVTCRTHWEYFDRKPIDSGPVIYSILEDEFTQQCKQKYAQEIQELEMREGGIKRKDNFISVVNPSQRGELSKEAFSVLPYESQFKRMLIETDNEETDTSEGRGVTKKLKN